MHFIYSDIWVISRYFTCMLFILCKTATASSVKTAHKAIIKHHPDFIFLHIEMADGKGLTF